LLLFKRKERNGAGDNPLSIPPSPEF